MNTNVYGERKRIEWIDIAKGLLIILVIFGHLNAVKWFPKLDGIIKWIYSFHMMAFFILSGMVFNPRTNFIAFLSSKLKTLLIPYGVFSIFGLLGVYKQFLINKNFGEFVGNIFTTYVYGEGMWFLCALFSIEIVFYFLIRVKKGHLLILFVLMFIGWGYYHYMGGASSKDRCFYLCKCWILHGIFS